MIDLFLKFLDVLELDIRNATVPDNHSQKVVEERHLLNLERLLALLAEYLCRDNTSNEWLLWALFLVELLDFIEELETFIHTLTDWLGHEHLGPPSIDVHH